MSATHFNPMRIVPILMMEYFIRGSSLQGYPSILTMVPLEVAYTLEHFSSIIICQNGGVLKGSRFYALVALIPFSFIQARCKHMDTGDYQIYMRNYSV